MFRDDKTAVKDACSYVYEKLREDSCRRLCNYKGKNNASEKTYFYTQVRYRLMDFRRILENYRKKHPEHDPDLPDQPDPSAPGSDEKFFWEQIKVLVNSILQNPNEESTKDPASEIIKRLTRKIKSEFKPTSKDREFLKMIYKDGMTVTAAGRDCGWNENQSSGRHRRLLIKLREIIPKDVLEDLISCFEN